MTGKDGRLLLGGGKLKRRVLAIRQYRLQYVRESDDAIATLRRRVDFSVKNADLDAFPAFLREEKCSGSRQ